MMYNMSNSIPLSICMTLNLYYSYHIHKPEIRLYLTAYMYKEAPTILNRGNIRNFSLSYNYHTTILDKEILISASESIQ